MLTETSTTLRSASPSLILRAVRWVMRQRKPVFPKDASTVPAYLAARTPPRDAPMPAKFERRYDPGARDYSRLTSPGGTRRTRTRSPCGLRSVAPRCR